MDARTVTVGATPTLLADQGDHIAPLSLHLGNASGKTVFLGQSSVTTSTGLALPDGQTLPTTLFEGDKVYGVVATGSANVVVLETLAEGGVAVTAIPRLGSVLQQGNDAGGHKIVDMGAPTASSDAATKSYADNVGVGQLKVTAAAGAVATADITVTGITTADALVGVLRLNRDATAANIDLLDVRAEAAITSTNHIRLSSTNTTGDTLVVLWWDKTP